MHGIPKINSILNIYFVNRKNEYLYRVFFENSDIFFQKNNSIENKKFFNIFNSNDKIKIQNKNIIFLLGILSGFNLKSYVGEMITQIKFENDEISLELNTPLGNILHTKKKLPYKELKNDIITKLFLRRESPKKVFDKFGNINEKLINYGSIFNIDFSQLDDKSLEFKLKMKSNDYSFYEEIFKNIFNQKINPKIDNFKRLKKYFKPMLIIIPSYNSENSILKVLLAIESQNLYKKDKKEIDVIIIDDGSKMSVKDILETSKIEKELTYSLRVVRLESNQGLSNARNLGIALAKNDLLLFIDSDILLAKNYLLEHSLLLQLFPNSLFFSLKSNIEKNDNLILDKNIKKGLLSPKKFNDKRLSRKFSVNQLWVNEVLFDGRVNILSETKNLKELGFGRVINGYDLSSMLVGHNFSISKKSLRDIRFSNEFKGWGVEDTLFGTENIAAGNFIIPLLNTGVYHINHPVRSGSLEEQTKEYKKNLEIYKEIISKKYE